MNIVFLRKMYPYLNANIKNRKWRTLTNKELDALMQEKQVISNCYDVAVRYALMQTKKGRELIKKVIKISKNDDGKRTCKITFHIKDKIKTYRSITSKKRSLGELIGSAVGKMIRCNQSQKPLISRLGRFGFHRYQEFNKPSNAFFWYTGEKAVSIGENCLFPDLKKYKDRVINLLNKISDSKDKSSFVVISSIKPNELNGKRRWHCLPIVDIDKHKKQLKIIDKRTNNIIKLSFDDLINNFKAIVGIVS